jgi:hypothetical protein
MQGLRVAFCRLWLIKTDDTWTGEVVNFIGVECDVVYLRVGFLNNPREEKIHTTGLWSFQRLWLLTEGQHIRRHTGCIFEVLVCRLSSTEIPDLHIVDDLIFSIRNHKAGNSTCSCIYKAYFADFSC